MADVLAGAEEKSCAGRGRAEGLKSIVSELREFEETEVPN